MKELVCLGIFVFLSAIFSIMMIVAGFVCQYKKTTAAKSSTYECGLSTFGDAKVKFDIRYFNYAILFLIFDIETFFLYPFAVSINALGKFVVLEVFVFVAIIVLALVFAIKKKVLRWI